MFEICLRIEEFAYIALIWNKERRIERRNHEKKQVKWAKKKKEKTQEANKMSKKEKINSRDKKHKREETW